MGSGMGQWDSQKQIQVDIYGAAWCGFTKKHMDDFEQVIDEYHGKNINGCDISVNYIDGDKEPEKTKKDKVKGFPTIILKEDGKEVSRDLPREADKLGQEIEKAANSAN